jgi:hypothetical protein
VLRRRPAAWIASVLALGGYLVWFMVEILILQDLHWLHAMWGLPVIVGIAAGARLVPLPARSLRTCLLACGIASSLLYAAMNVFVAMRWPGYSSVTQTVSELSAVGAPTRPLWVVLATLYTMLVLGFGWGVWMVAGSDRRLRGVGALLIADAAIGFLWPIAPMHLREALAAGQGDWRDTLHIAFAIATQTLFLAAFGLAAAAMGRPFRLYSLATALALVFFAALVFREAPAIGLDQQTPLIGVWGRLDIAAFMLWVVVLAASLLGRGRVGDRATRPQAALALPHAARS